MKLNKELSGAEECLFHLNEELLERNLYSGDVLKIQFSLKLLKIMLDLRGWTDICEVTTEKKDLV